MLTSANSKSKSKSQPQQEVSTMPKAKFKPYLLEKFFLLNIFIDHHTVNSHLLMHVYNTDTVYELNSGQKKSDIFTFTIPIPYT